MEIIKFKFKASQARSIYHYKKLKIKVLKCNACMLRKDGTIQSLYVKRNIAAS